VLRSTPGEESRPLRDRVVTDAGQIGAVNSVWLRRLAPILVILAAVAGSAPSVGNRFAYDDRVAVEDNPAVRDLQAPSVYFQQPFYPGDPSVYRPFTALGFAVQWRIGHGSPAVFHATTVALKAVASLAFLAVAGLLLPGAVALAVALIFAVHPVHSEAVGSVVGQAELHMTIGVLLAAFIYLHSRRRGGPVLKTAVGLALTAIYSAASKEQGIMIPAILLMLEVTVVDDRRSRWERVRLLAPTYGVMALALAGFWALRSDVLAGNLAGPIAWPWRGLSAADRILTMLGLVPQWLRLLVWPWHLSIEYNPPAFPVATSWGVNQSAGLLAVLGAVGLAWWGRRTARPVTAGLLWAAIALFPVSNLLIPTGIMMAERTLMGPSVGFLIGVGGITVWLLSRLPGERVVRGVLAAAAVVVVTAFTWRSAIRMRVWKDDASVIRQMVIDEPRSYFAHFNQGLWLESQGQWPAAEQEFRAAISLWDGDGRMLEHLAGVYWKLGRYDEVVPLLQRTLTIEENRPAARLMLHDVLEKLHRPDDARAVALRGIELGDPGFAPRVSRLRRGRR